MSIGQISLVRRPAAGCGQSRGVRTERHPGNSKKSRLLLLIAGGLLLGLISGFLIRAVWALDPAVRLVCCTSLMFFGGGAAFLIWFSRAERAHELRLVACEEKQGLYYGLLDRLWAGMDALARDHAEPANHTEHTDPADPANHTDPADPAGPLRTYIQEYRTAFYTYAAAPVIDAVNVWLRCARAESGRGGALSAAGLLIMEKKCKAVIKAVQTDLGRKIPDYCDDCVFPHPRRTATEPAFRLRLVK